MSEINDVLIKGQLMWEPYMEQGKYLSELHVDDSGFFTLDLTNVKGDMDFGTYVANKLPVKVSGKLKTDTLSNAYIVVKDVQFSPNA